MDQDVKEMVDIIIEFTDRIGTASDEEALDLTRDLFGTIVSRYPDSPGMKAIMLSTALGDYKDMPDGRDTLYFDEMARLTLEAGLRPSDVNRDEMRKASKKVFGSETAFIY